MNKNRNIFIDSLKNYKNLENFYNANSDKKQSKQKIAKRISSEMQYMAKRLSEDLSEIEK